LGAISMAFNMGCDFVKDEVRAITGMSDPTVDDEVLSAALLQQSSAPMPASDAGLLAGGDGNLPDDLAGPVAGGFDASGPMAPSARRRRPLRYAAGFAQPAAPPVQTSAPAGGNRQGGTTTLLSPPGGGPVKQPHEFNREHPGLYLADLL